MKLLVDTHALIWMATNDAALSKRASAALIDPSNDVFVSAANFYEIELKRRRKRMPANLPQDMQTVCQAEGFILLHITPEDASEAARLPDLHRDPWDRILVAQAMRRGMSVVTRDKEIPDYGVPVVW